MKRKVFVCGVVVSDPFWSSGIGAYIALAKPNTCHTVVRPRHPRLLFTKENEIRVKIRIT